MLKGDGQTVSKPDPLTKEQETALKDVLTHFNNESSPFSNIISLFRQLHSNIDSLIKEKMNQIKTCKSNIAKMNEDNKEKELLETIEDCEKLIVQKKTFL